METPLAEQLLLVAFDARKGRPIAHPQVALPFAVAGAVVIDLVLRHGSGLANGRVEAGPDTGDPVLDHALGRIRADAKGRDVRHWVKKLAGRPADLVGRTLAHLTDENILEERDARVLGFKVRPHNLVDQEAPDRVGASVHDALVGDGARDSGLTSLVALVAAAGLVDGVVSRDERPLARRRAKEIGKGDPSAEAVNSAVKEVEAAVMAGVIASIAASLVTSSGHGH